MLRKGSKMKRALALILATAMVSQNCMVTSIGSDVVPAETSQSEADAAAQKAAEEAAAAQKAAEEAAAQQAAEEAAAAQKAAEEAAAAQKAAEEAAAAQQAAEDAAAQKAAEEEAAAQKAAEEAAAGQTASEQQTEAVNNTETTGGATTNSAPTESQQPLTTVQVDVTEESTSETDKSNTETEKQNDTKEEGKQETGTNETEKQDVIYRVTFDSHAADYGKLQVKDEANAVTADVITSYYKEVKENDPFTFTVIPSEGYTVEYVRADQVDIPKTENANEYRIANVTKDTVITVTYKELPQDTADEEENTEEDGQVRNTVTFEPSVGATVLVDGTDVTNATGEAVDGKIVFSVIPTDGYEVISVLVDGTIDARTTENENEYIIEGIQTDETIVSITTEWVGTEEESEAETEVETETEVESEIETETETEVEIETEVETETETEVETETETESESETEAEKPAFNYSETVDGTTVNITAEEGVLPAGTTVTISPLTENVIAAVAETVEADLEENKKIVQVLGYDITFYDAEGKEIQPEGFVSVSYVGLPISDEAEEMTVYHTDENGGNAKEVSTTVASDTVGFTADEFSPYPVVLSAETNDITTYEVDTINIVSGSGTSNDPYIVNTGTSVTITTGYKNNGSWGISKTGRSGWSEKSLSGLASLTNPYAGSPGFMGWGGDDAGVTLEVDENAKDGSNIVVRFGRNNSYDYWYFQVSASSELSVSFNLNRGYGTTPATITGVEAGEIITMPASTDFQRAGYVFVGWSLNNDANGREQYKPEKTPSGTIYSAGSSEFVMPNNSVTLYATWASQDVDAEFYIRLDGTIPTEPQGHDSTQYTSAIAISDAIKIATFYTDSTNGVADRLNSIPTTEQIQRVYPSYNPENQYVLWYVIKHETTWHVDGVLLDKSKVNLSYNANAPAGTWSNMPDGQQYNKGDTAVVSSKVPTRTGYEFIGWNTRQDGQGTSYSGNGRFTITEDTTLYAQWRANSRTPYTVQWYDADTGDKIAPDETRYNSTDASVAVTDEDKVVESYIFAEEDERNVLYGTVEADGSLVLKLYFHKATGSLTLEKVLKDSTVKEEADTFTFTVTAPTDVVLSEADVKVGGTDAAVTNNSITVALTPENQEGTLSASATITGLPVGTYTITETGTTNDDGTLTVNGKTYTVSTGGSSTVTDGGTATYTVTNTRRETAKLTVTKTWENADGLAAIPSSLDVSWERSDETTGSITLSAAENWRKTVEVEMFDANGKTYSYDVTENLTASGYTKTPASGTVTATLNEETKTYSAAFTNSRDTGKGEDEGGSLTITKTIVAPADLGVTDEMKADTFNFTVTGPQDLTGSVEYQIGNADSKTAVVTNHSFTIEGVKHGDTVTVLSALPTGTYSISETPNTENSFTYEAKVTDEQTLTKGGSVSFAATNTLQYEDEFTVAKEWQQPDGTYKSTAYGDADAEAVIGLYTTDGKAYTVNDTPLTVTTVDGTATFTNIPYGEYILKEENLPSGVEGYVKDNKTIAITVGENGAVAKDGSELKFQNDLETDKSLEIEKVVDWNGTAPEDEEFAIEFSYKTLTGETVRGTVTATYSADSKEVSYQIQTGDGEAVTGNTLTNLPYGTAVTLTETVDGWTPSGAVTVSGTPTDNGSVTATGTVTVTGTEQKATVTNTRDLFNNGSGKLTATKIWAGEYQTADVKPDEVTIELWRKDGDSEAEKVTEGETAESTITFENLPKTDLASGEDYEYSVREQGAAETPGQSEGESTWSIVFTDNAGKSSEYAVTYGENYTVTNTYTDPDDATLTITAAKDLVGRDLEDGYYHFTAAYTDGGESKTLNAANDGDGKVSFGAITLSRTGDYTVTVSEVREAADGIEIDGDVEYTTVTHTVTFTVDRNAENALVIKNIAVDGTPVEGQPTAGQSSVNVNAGTFINTTKTGSLTLEKVLKDSTVKEEADTFTFTVTAPMDVVLSEADVKVGGDDVTVTNNSITVQLTPEGQEGTLSASATITGLPVGTYTITEMGDNSSSVTGSGTLTVNGKTYTVTTEGNNTVTDSGTATYTVTNTRKETAKLTVTKTWENADGLAAIPESLNVSWERSDKTTGSITLSAAENWRKTVEVEMLDANGKTYSYDVTENLTASGYTKTPASGSVTATLNEETKTYSAAFTNSRDTGKGEDEGGSLTITKTIVAPADPGVTDEMKADTFNFTVTGPQDLTGSVEYQIGNADSKTAVVTNH